MAGTTQGGKTAANKMKALYGEDYYSIIGQKGGKVKADTKGFGYRAVCYCREFDGERHFQQQCAGKKGGRISRKNRLER